MVIACFPRPYGDELFYSVCARYQAIMKYPGSKILRDILFETHRCTAALDLPGYLDVFVRNLARGHKWSVDRIIDEHTMLPYYGAFLPKELLARLRSDLRDGNITGIRNRMGIMSSRVTWLKWLRFCPACVQEEREAAGECYWHRLHQAPGVFICPQHCVYLEDSSIAIVDRRNKNSYVAADNVIPVFDKQKARHLIMRKRVSWMDGTLKVIMRKRVSRS
jgi:hypothetical protein